MSVKECDHHSSKRRKLLRRIFAGTLIFLFIVLLVFLITWAILRPTKPKLVLQDVTLYAFNATVPNLFTATMQITLVSRNPNDEISIYYDRLDVYATYRSQQVTLRTRIPPTYQGHNENDIWSPFLIATAVPISPYNSDGLRVDQQSGAVLLTIKVDGRIRWKVGAVVTGRYHLHARCPAVITFGIKGKGMVVGDNVVKYPIVTGCKVSV